MSLRSDLTIDASKFDRKLADKQTEEFNEKLIKIWADGPRWYEVCFTKVGTWGPADRCRSALKSTASFAGKARHRFQSLLCFPKESMARYLRVMLAERSRTVCSNLLAG